MNNGRIIIDVIKDKKDFFNGLKAEQVESTEIAEVQYVDGTGLSIMLDDKESTSITIQHEDIIELLQDAGVDL